MLLPDEKIRQSNSILCVLLYVQYSDYSWKNNAREILILFQIFDLKFSTQNFAVLFQTSFKTDNTEKNV